MKGAHLTAEANLDALGRVDVDFDNFGTPRLPMLVVHPSMAGVLWEELRRIKDEPVLKTVGSWTVNSRQDRRPHHLMLDRGLCI
jgi:hypothetical protein